MAKELQRNEMDLDRINEAHFVGRGKEIRIFQSMLLGAEPHKRILNIHGVGGLGKTCLLEKFKRISESHQALFLKLDSRDMIHTPEAFANQVLFLLRSRYGIETDSGKHPVETCIKSLNDAAKERNVCLALDTYEEWAALDHWVRGQFLPLLHKKIILAIAGRYPLPLPWMSSPALRSMIEPLPLEAFTRLEVADYLSSHSPASRQSEDRLWSWTKGHPLMLAMAVEASKESGREYRSADSNMILEHFADYWLSEVSDERLRTMVDASSIMRVVHHELLEFVLKQEVSSAEFQQLVRFSFIHRINGGWVVHQIMGEAVRKRMKLASPSRYEAWTRRCLNYYYRRIGKSQAESESTALELAHFLYYLGDPVIRAVYYNNLASSNEFEYLTPQNYPQLLEYIEARCNQASSRPIAFRDSETNRDIESELIAYLDRKNFELLDAESLLTLPEGSVRLLREPSKEIAALLIMVPIQSDTIEYLVNQPVSGPVFRSLMKDVNSRISKKEGPVGWFIRMLDNRRMEDDAVRSDLFRCLSTYLLSGGMLIHTTPSLFLHGVLEKLGFQKMGDFTHDDYGTDYPSTPFVLDTREGRLTQYLDHLLDIHRIPRPTLEDHLRGLGYTRRESEVAALLLECQSNEEIASRLFITEVAVKKHLGRIYKKAQVDTRAQMIMMLMKCQSAMD